LVLLQEQDIERAVLEWGGDWNPTPSP
jgi:hypothetical protein